MAAGAAALVAAGFGLGETLRALRRRRANALVAGSVTRAREAGL